MNRDELVEAGARALRACDVTEATFGPPHPIYARRAAAVLDSVENLIRADERGRNREADGVEAYLAVENVLIDLRAKVQKLHEAPYPHIHYGGEPTGWRVALNAVLILLDQYGSSDE